MLSTLEGMRFNGRANILFVLGWPHLWARVSLEEILARVGYLGEDKKD